jgi:hypothetical protein
MQKRFIIKPVSLPTLKKYHDIPRNINPSAILSIVESRSAPNLVALPLTLATTPSIRSKVPPASMKIPPQKRLKGIMNPDNDVIIIPIKVITFGLTGRAFANGVSGLSKK